MADDSATEVAIPNAAPADSESGSAPLDAPVPSQENNKNNEEGQTTAAEAQQATSDEGKEGSKDRKGSKSRSRSRSPRSRSRGRGRGGSRSRSRSRNRSRSRSRSRSRNRRYRESRYSRSRREGRDRDRGRDRRGRDRDRDRDRDRRRRRRRSRSRSRERRRRSSRSRSRERVRRRKRSRSASGSRSKSEDKEQKERSPTPEAERERRKKEKEYHELTRDVRTVFVSQLQIKCRKKDLKRFFVKICGIKLNDIILIRDEITGRSKGIAYVELSNIEDLPKALLLNGQKFQWKSGKQGLPIAVQASEAEKNYQHEKAKLATQAAKPNAAATSRRICIKNLPSVFAANEVSILCRPIGELDGEPTVTKDVSGAGSAIVTFKKPEDAATAVTKINGFETMDHKLVVEFLPDSSEPASQTGSMPNIITQALAAARGDAQTAALTQSTTSSQITNANAAQVTTGANAAGISGLMGVGAGAATTSWLHAQQQQQQQQAAQGPDREQIVNPTYTKLTPASRQHLMTQLASRAGLTNSAPNSNVSNTFASGANTVPLGVRRPNPPPSDVPGSTTTALGTAGVTNSDINAQQAATSAVGAPLGTPSSCLVLKNMFDAAEEAAESGENWDALIKEDVTGEVSKCGNVQHCHVDRNSQGFVYLMLDSDLAGSKVGSTFHGRFFAGRQLSVQYFPKHVYLRKFPEATSVA